MYNERGSTLISTLFAFEIYVVVLISFMLMMSQMRSSMHQIAQLTSLWEETQAMKGEDDPLKAIAGVLHS